ncbi:hypothetical protein OYC64_005351 [Pagothenia borchgrevinki]|uniref:G-protein coupled receptors family 1 profile domain-containing protein n=1 Tax=Pagothenia borchgrevinki TaxID=8213 RepID=A0ABD2GFP7_PAGBO
MTTRATNKNSTPFFYSADEKIGWRKVKILCLWVWLYGLIWALLPVLGWGRYGPEPFGLSCSLAWGQMKHEGFTFVVSLFTFNLVLPSIIILCCYFGIAIKLFFTYKKSISNINRVPNNVKLHRRLLVIAVLISFGFIVCWTPYAIVSMWSILGDSSSIPPEVSLLPCMFAKSSTVYNPLIYYIFSKSFRREVKQLGSWCLGWGPCHASNTIKDNNISMNYAGEKSKAEVLTTLQQFVE